MYFAAKFLLSLAISYLMLSMSDFNGVNPSVLQEGL